MDQEQWDITASVTDMLSLHYQSFQDCCGKNSLSEVGGVIRARSNYLGCMMYRCIYIHSTVQFYRLQEY